MHKKQIGLILLIIFSAYIFLFGLGKMALLDPDEPFYSETAREMIDRGEWLTPRIFGEPQFEKPPLYYWLTILSYKAFGINEFSARFPSAIFGILGIVGIYLLAGHLFSERTALYASLVMATSAEYLILARACVTDMVLCVSILYFFLFFFYAYNEERKRMYCIFCSACLALGVLTKGPVALVLPVFIVGLYLLIKKDFKAIFKFPIVTGTVVFCVISIPWYYLMYRTYGHDFISHFFGFQNITRFLHPEHRIGDVFYYYIPVVFAGFLPWSIFLPSGVVKIFKKDKKEFSAHLFLLIWIAVFFIFFSISRSKLATYIFPLFPALAIFLGRFWELKIDEKTKGIDWGIILSGVVYALSLPITLAVFYVISLKKYADLCPAILKLGIPLTLFYLVSLVFLLKRKISVFFISIVITFAISVIPLVLLISPKVSLYESSKDFAGYLKNLAKPNERIGAETDYRRGVAFYLGNEGVIDVHKHDVITKFLLLKERVWCVVKNKNYALLYEDIRAPYKKTTYVVYERGKKVIITNKLPENGKFIKKRP